MRRIGNFFPATGLVTIAIIVTIGVAVTVLWLVSEIGTEDELKSDFTIFLDEPLVREGGVVIIQPEAVDLEGDKFTALTTGTHKLTISSQVTIVRFQYPRAGTFIYRFEPLDPRTYPDTSGQTARIRFGSAWDYDPDNPEVSEEIPKYFTHHFQTIAGDWTIEKSRQRSSTLPKGFLRKRFNCVEETFSMICDAIDGDERR